MVNRSVLTLSSRKIKHKRNKNNLVMKCLSNVSAYEKTGHRCTQISVTFRGVTFDRTIFCCSCCLLLLLRWKRQHQLADCHNLASYSFGFTASCLTCFMMILNFSSDVEVYGKKQKRSSFFYFSRGHRKFEFSSNCISSGNER